MKLTIAALLLTLASTLSADPVPACQTGTLASYIALTSGCSFGGLVFDSFSYGATLLSTVPVPAATTITVTPSAAGDVSLEFSGDFGADSLQVQDAGLDFDVSTEDGTATIDGAGLSADASFTGAGVVTIGENINGLLPYHLEVDTSVAGTSLSDQLIISPPLQSLTISKDITLTGAVGTASMTEFTETFSQVAPEPNLAPLGGGFLLIAAWIRRRRKQ